jgi:H+/Cl- antiporter ClcA
MRWARLAADATAAIVGFAIFFAVNAGWANLIRSLDLPTFEFGLPELAIAVGFGVFGAIIGTVFKLSTVGTQKLAAPLAGRPVLRCTGVGLILGLVGMALPLTLFLGTEGLVDVTSHPAELGIGLILVSALVKILATTGALSFGFVGGPIFPLLFVGGSLGSVAHLAIPGIPLGLAVAAMMAAVPSAVIPVPLSIATLTVLIAGIPATESTVVFAAAIVALVCSQAIAPILEKSKPKPTAA